MRIRTGWGLLICCVVLTACTANAPKGPAATVTTPTVGRPPNGPPAGPGPVMGSFPAMKPCSAASVVPTKPHGPNGCGKPRPRLVRVGYGASPAYWP